MKKKCPYCKKLFQPLKNQKITCGRAECKKKHKAKYIAEKLKKCPYCKKMFKPFKAKKVTCGSPLCRREHEHNRYKIRAKETERMLKSLDKIVDSLSDLSQKLKTIIKNR